MAQQELRIDPGIIRPLVSVMDSHVHIGNWPAFDLSFSIENLELEMSKYGIEGAVVMPALVGDPLLANIYLRKQVKDDSRFYMFAWVGPRKNDDLVDWVGANVAPSNGVCGMKFHASISQVGIYDARMESFLEIADRFELPFLYHAGRTSISWPDKLMPIAPSYPKAKFIIAHLGGNAYDRIYDTLRKWPTLPENVYVESSTARHPDLLVRAIEQWGDDRVLYGSDLPFTDMRLNWDCIRYAGLEEHEGFMGENLRRLLKAR